MQGFNMGRYVPPDLEGTTTGNQLHRRRAPGTLRKDNTQTVRFEMPYAVWCHTCKPHAIIAQGARFNAEKVKVGYYHTTPIWRFRITHRACGGIIEIRTDPKNIAYVVTEGGKARDYGEDKDRITDAERGLSIVTPEEREQRREDAFAQLEGRVEKKEAALDTTRRIAELQEARDRDWSDPWAANKKLRDSFRRDRKARHREEKATEALKGKMALDTAILPEAEEDAQKAKSIKFGGTSADTRQRPVASRPVFNPYGATRVAKPQPRAKKVSYAHQVLRQMVVDRREEMNPFGKPMERKRK